MSSGRTTSSSEFQMLFSLENRKVRNFPERRNKEEGNKVLTWLRPSKTICFHSCKTCVSHQEAEAPNDETKYKMIAKHP